MPSLNPRLALTLPPHRHDLLKRLAALQGVSMASVVSELLEECYPVLERVCVALEAAKHASDSAKEGLRESCDQALVELEPYRVAVSDQFDLFMDGITRQLNGVEERGCSPRERGAPLPSTPVVAPSVNPRVVTRGSGSPTPPPSASKSKSAKPSPKRVSGVSSKKSPRRSES